MRRHPVLWVVIAELFGTSLWFSANAAGDDLRAAWGLSAGDIGWLTNAVQIGFIVGALASAATGLADRVSASRLFTASCIVGATANAAFALFSDGLASAIALRFAVGVALAGIYPLGMKMVVAWDPRRAGNSLGMLVGMLTLGTALPHLIRAVGSTLSWQTVVLTSSALALLAAGIASALGDGPHLQHSPTAARWQLAQPFRDKTFRASAFGYFGHMWELYAFWALTPALVAIAMPNAGTTTIAAWSFAIIGVGAVGSIAGGLLAGRSPRRGLGVARAALLCSGLMCALTPLVPDDTPALAIGLLLVWGLSVIPDSPQFSALSATAAPNNLVGSALTIQNSIGFAITTVSIAISTSLVGSMGSAVGWLLLPGPILGLLAISRGSTFARLWLCR